MGLPVGSMAIKGLTKLAEGALSGVNSGIEGLKSKETIISELRESSKKKALEPDIEKAKSSSLESIIELNKEKSVAAREVAEASDSKDAKEKHAGEAEEGRCKAYEAKEGLTDDEKRRIKEESGWSDEVIDNISSWKEYEIYRDAGLQEVEIGGRKALIRPDIDWNQKDEKGRTNAERARQGLAPLDKDGNAIELHHIGQHADSPLAELTFEEHRGGGNDTILHDKNKGTETHGEGNTWNNERQNYWKDRYEYNGGEQNA